MKIFLRIIAGVIIGIVGAIFGSIGLSDIKKMPIENVDLAKINDGVYKGKFHKTRWTYEVEVAVNGHKITSIKTTNEKLGPRQKKVSDSAIGSIIAKQSVKIDAVSGATVDTKAFCKAVENALGTGTKE
jgi:uncharacterized protein with FMN-binding domain